MKAQVEAAYIENALDTLQPTGRVVVAQNVGDEYSESGNEGKEEGLEC